MKKYDTYKPSGVEWLGDIPEHWEVKKVTHIFNKIGSGTTPTAGTPKYYDNGQINWLQTGDLNDSVINETNKKITIKAINEFSTLKQYPKESIVIAMYGATIGKLGYLNIETTTNQACCVLGNPNRFVSKFAFYSFMNTKSTIISMSYGGGQPNISQDLVKSLRLVVPPFPEQEKIAQFLDDKTTKIDKAISIKQQQIELLKERRQILIHQAVTKGIKPNVKFKDSGVEWIGEIPESWEVKKVKYLLKERNERSINGTEPLFMMSQLHGLVVRSDFHSKAEVAQSSEGNKIVYRDDLVFNKLKAHLGVFFKSNIEFKGIVSPDYAVYYSRGIIQDLKYLELLFRNPEYIKEFICRATGIVEGLIRLYTADLFDIPVAVPPIKEQLDILNHIETATTKIATAISLKEQEIEKLKEYKSSLINDVVTGKMKID